MAGRQILLRYQGQESAFGFSRLTRDKLYGKRVRQHLDGKGEPCTRASLTSDGAILIQKGMTAQGYFGPQGEMVSIRDLVGLDDSGQPLPEQPGTLGVPQDLSPAAPTELTDVRVHAVYALDPESVSPELEQALDRGELFSFTFNYRADYRSELGFLLRNDAGLFALIGQPQRWAWSELASLPDVVDEDTADDDSLDFEMF
ncbi:MAG: hypothetical protein VX899_24320 [Myxococcota bacterium]|nr:hypothetical protein [Myxococcota bacterium]